MHSLVTKTHLPYLNGSISFARALPKRPNFQSKNINFSLQGNHKENDTQIILKAARELKWNAIFNTKEKAFSKKKLPLAEADIYHANLITKIGQIPLEGKFL